MYYVVYLSKFVEANLVERESLDNINQNNYCYIFETKEKALELFNKYNSLYNEFKNSYLDPFFLLSHYDTLRYVRDQINENLKSYENYKGIDFCDVHAYDGIQVRLFDKRVDGYSLESQATLKYNLENVEEVIKESIEIYRNASTQETIGRYNYFLKTMI